MTLLMLLSLSAQAKDWTAMAPGTASPRVLLKEAQREHPPEEGEDEDEAMEGRDFVHILYQGTYIEIDAQGRERMTYHRVYELASQDAVTGWGSTQAHWSPWHQNRPEMHARVITPQGKVFELDPSTLTEAGAQSGSALIYTEDMLIEGPLPGVVQGAVVEEWVTWSEHRPFMESGAWGRNYLSAGLPVDKVRVTLSAPEGEHFKWKAELLENAQPKVNKDGTLEFVFEDVKPYRDYEAGQPDELPLAPAIAWSLGGTWADFAAEYLQMSQDRIDSTGLERQVKKAQQDAPDTLALIGNLLAWMREEVRYTGLEFGQSSIVPYAPQQTLERGYGDCKDKATLLISALSLAGVPAHLALLNAGSARDTDPELPGSSQFDHAIVYVPELDLFVDPTSEWTGAGSVPPSDQGRWALIAAPGTTDLVKIPRAQSQSAVWAETTVWQMGLGTATVQEDLEVSGWLSAGIRGYYAERSEEEQERALKESREEWDSDTGEWELPNLEQPERPFHYQATWPDSKAVAPEVDRFTIPLNPRSVLSMLPEYALSEARDPDREDDEPKRREALQLRPLQADTHVRVVVPSGFVMPELPDDVDLSAGPVSLSARYTLPEAGVLEVHFHLDTGDGGLSPEETEALWEAVSVWRRANPSKLEFLGLIPYGLEENTLQEQAAELTALIQGHPTQAGYHMMQANAFRTLALREPAIEAAILATVLEPENLEAWRLLADLAYTDEMAQDRLPYDRDAALAAVEQALILDPTDKTLLTWKAKLLEAGHDGTPWGEGRDLDQALLVYELLIEESDYSSRWERAQREIYWRMGDYERYLEEIDPPYRSGRALAALAATKGARAASQEIRRLSLEPEAQQQLIGRVTIELTYQREQQLARQIWAEGMKDKSKKDPLARRKGIDPFEELKPYEQLIQEHEGEPRWPVMQLQHLVTTGQDPSPVLSPAFQVLMEDLDWLPKYFLTESEKPNWSSPEALMDLGFAALEFESEGDAEHGWRVETLLAGESYGPVYYVAEGPDGPVVAGISLLPASTIGAQAWVYFEQGELAAATQWVDWAWKEQGGTPTDSDPLSSYAVQRFWNPDKEHSPEHLKAAIGLLLSVSEHNFETAERVLSEAMPLFEGDEQLQLRRGLLNAQEGLEHWEAVLETVAPLLEQHPNSVTHLYLKADALAALGRHDQAIAWADALAPELSSETPWLLSLRARTRTDAADLAGATALYLQVVESKEPTANELNTLAWAMALEGTELEDALDFAIRSNTMESSPTVNALHTLAVIYGQLGEHGLEKATLDLALKQTADYRLLGDEWNVVYGDLAMAAGSTQWARTYYERVEEDSAPDSTWTFALRGLAALDAMEQAD